jgi:hypothetical protein
MNVISLPDIILLTTDRTIGLGGIVKTLEKLRFFSKLLFVQLHDQ